MKFMTGEFFYVDRWLASSAFSLPIEVRGLYREMLSRAWLNGAKLPNDHDAIKRLVGASEKEWRRCWPSIERYWRIDGAFLVNDVQRKIYATSVARASRGQRGAGARAQLQLLK
jgi:uncharacterized protein YdaU (DUF1376 family)